MRLGEAMQDAMAVHTHCLLLLRPGSVQLPGGSDERLHLLQPPVQHVLLAAEGRGESMPKRDVGRECNT